jgi:hypothetical protein
VTHAKKGPIDEKVWLEAGAHTVGNAFVQQIGLYDGRTAPAHND